MTQTHEAIAAIGLARHPAPAVIEAQMNKTSDRVRRDGARAIELARNLASTGYPSSTLGDGGSRGSDDTSSTERAAGVLNQRPMVNRWADADRRLAAAFAVAHKANQQLEHEIANIVAHAADLDPVPVGTGECQACGRFCRPDKDRPGNRLRSGLCPTDYRAWLRAGQPQRNEWVRTRRTDFTDENGVLHTPEPDHDIDLTRELGVTIV